MDQHIAALLRVYPTPWRLVPDEAIIGQWEVRDADDEPLMIFDTEDEFLWRGIVAAVNHAAQEPQP